MFIFHAIHDAFYILRLGVRENKSARKFSKFSQTGCAKMYTNPRQKISNLLDRRRNIPDNFPPPPPALVFSWTVSVEEYSSIIILPLSSVEGKPEPTWNRRSRDNRITSFESNEHRRDAVVRSDDFRFASASLLRLGCEKFREGSASARIVFLWSADSEDRL